MDANTECGIKQVHTFLQDLKILKWKITSFEQFSNMVIKSDISFLSEMLKMH